MNWSKLFVITVNLLDLTYNVSKIETLPLEKVYILRKVGLIFVGFWLLGEHYDVHRFHPPLVYGRKGDADVGEGICCCVGK